MLGFLRVARTGLGSSAVCLYITEIEHVISKSMLSIGRVKLQFHPGTNMAQAMTNRVLRHIGRWAGTLRRRIAP